MSAARDRRRKYLVDKHFQIRYVILVILVLVLCIAIGVTLASIGFKSIYGPADAGSLERLSRVNFLFWMVLLAVLILLLAVGFYGVRMSHRIAGPIYAFSRHLNLVKQGIYYEDMRLRKNDEFQSLAGAFNACLDSMREREKQAAAKLEELARTMDNLAQILSQESSTSAEAAKLREIIETIRELTDEHISHLQPRE